MVTNVRHDIRIDDVWRTAKGKRDVTVVQFMTRGPHGGNVTYRGKTGAEMFCLPANFTKGRSLVERSGVRVGDVRAIGKASTVKVLHIREDGATCENATGNDWLLLSYIAALPLVSRDGKAV